MNESITNLADVDEDADIGTHSANDRFVPTADIAPRNKTSLPGRNY